MREMPATAFVACCAVGFMLSMSSHGAAAAENSVKIPAGAKAEIHGNTAIIRNGGGGNGVVGTYNCACVGEPGACVVTPSGPVMLCSTPGPPNACGNCQFIVVTGGMRGVSPAAKSK